MATNKHAIIRFQALDKCFQNRYRKYFIEDLVKACCEALLSHCGIVDGVKKRQVFDDINFMISEEGYSIPLDKVKEGKRIYYRYSDPDYSINNQQISPSEIERLKETVQILRRFKGLPDFGWMEELLMRLEGAFRLKSNMEGVVSFEQNPYLRGLEHFDGLFHAIINKQVLSISYQASFGKMREYTMHSYHLKQYNSRWFLFGLAGGRIMTMAIDRIGEFKVVFIPYIENTDTDFDEYFDDVVGVTVPQSKEPEQIILRIDKDRYRYIESKPIHSTQKVMTRSEEQVTIGLKLIPNYEFETLLLGFADSIEIVEPADLRERVIVRAQKIIEKNTTCADGLHR